MFQDLFIHFLDFWKDYFSIAISILITLLIHKANNDNDYIFSGIIKQKNKKIRNREIRYVELLIDSLVISALLIQYPRHSLK